MGEGGLAERRKENTGEKHWKESIPPDHYDMIVFRPFFEPDGSMSGSELVSQLLRGTATYRLASR